MSRMRDSRSSIFGVVPGGDERVKPGDRAAGDRDADERKNRSGKNQAAAIDETRKRRHLQRRMNQNHCDRERRHSAEF